LSIVWLKNMFHFRNKVCLRLLVKIKVDLVFVAKVPKLIV
jgi:hypothetical protein